MKPRWLQVIELMRNENYADIELERLLNADALTGAPVSMFPRAGARMKDAVVLSSSYVRMRPEATIRMENGTTRTVPLRRLIYIDGLSTRLAPEDSLRVTRLRLKDALERRQRAKPGTPAWYRAAEDIKRGDREVSRLTEEADK